MLDRFCIFAAPFQIFVAPIGALIAISHGFAAFSVDFAILFEKHPQKTEGTSTAEKFPLAPSPSKDPKREFAAGN